MSSDPAAQPPPAMSSSKEGAQENLAPSSSTSSTSSLLLQTPRRDPAISSAIADALTSPRASLAEGSPSHVRSWSSTQRSQRTQSGSFSMTGFLMSPASKPNGSDPKFAGRDWRSVQAAEIIDPAETRFVELDTTIEDTTKLLIRSGAPNVVLVRESHKTRTAIGTFDYADLNAYLLLVLGLNQPDGAASALAERARKGEPIPLHAVLSHLGPREEPISLSSASMLPKVMEILGGGHHRVIVTKEGTTEAVGIISQLRLVRFFWENHQNFAATESLYAKSLKELALGTHNVTAIQGDKHVADALRLMHANGMTSLPVLDNQKNVVGNISQVDTRLLTDTSAIPLLTSSCLHFVSVILSERGINDGKDAYPIFYVTPYSTLAHTVAKLCATRSHRMWIVDAPSPSASVPQSPVPQATASSPSSSVILGDSTTLPPPSTPSRAAFGSSSESGAHSVGAGQLPGASMSGKINGVVSLTDVLNLLARNSGLSPNDPEETRRRRRQSSSSNYRPSMDSLRPSVDGGRPSAELLNSVSHQRSPSHSRTTR